MSSRLTVTNGIANFLPRAMSSRLTVTNGIANFLLQVCHVVVLENSDKRLRKSSAKDERSVVELIGNDQSSFAHERGDVHGIGGESHAEGDGVFGAQEFGDERFQLAVDFHGAEFPARAGDAAPVAQRGLARSRKARPFVLGETQVVVGT